MFRVAAWAILVSYSGSDDSDTGKRGDHWSQILGRDVATTVGDDMSKKSDMALRAHEQVCAERYGNINQALIEIKAKQAADSIQNEGRFNAMSNRMWAILITSLGGLIVACCVMAFYLITGAKG